MHIDRVPLHERNVGRLFVRDVIQQFEMRQTRPFLLRWPEGLAHYGRDCRRANDLVGQFRERRHRRNDVHDLETCLLSAQNPF